MTALFLMIPYIGISAYIIWHVFKLTSAISVRLRSKIFRSIFLIFFTVIATSPLTSFLIASGPLHFLLKKLNNIWLGFMLYIILILAVMDAVILILRLSKKISRHTLRSRHFVILTRSGALLLAIVVTIFGVINAGWIRTTHYDAYVDKPCDISELNVVLAADLHLGYSVGARHMEQMVKKINAANPDLVIIAGDIYDNEFEAIEEPEKIQELFASIQSKYGVFACWGNHDLEEPILAGFTFGSHDKIETDVRMAELLKNAGVHLLSDETVLIDTAFYLVGREDSSRARKTGSGRQSPETLLSGLDHSKPIIVIDHQPRELQALADAGADVDLSGHTHDGQIFPGNILTSLMWENSCGLLSVDSMTSVVTSGAGVWGPNMRVGTKSEIVQLRIHFKN